jgi:hypothetical protein
MTLAIHFDSLKYVDILNNGGITLEDAKTHANALSKTLPDSFLHDFATKSDLHFHVQTLRSEAAHIERTLKDDMNQLEKRLKEEIILLERNLKKEIADIRVDIGKLSADMKFLKWTVFSMYPIMISIGIKAFLG